MLRDAFYIAAIVGLAAVAAVSIAFGVFAMIGANG